MNVANRKRERNQDFGRLAFIHDVSLPFVSGTNWSWSLWRTRWCWTTRPTTRWRTSTAARPTSAPRSSGAIRCTPAGPPTCGGSESCSTPCSSEGEILVSVIRSYQGVLMYARWNKWSEKMVESWDLFSKKKFNIKNFGRSWNARNTGCPAIAEVCLVQL